ncbi:hypothetical protein [Corynebacterium callunae]|uniref:Uncharacterized protein n=1 Tax=Corynebacterium callunae DSM 20147 TaxID=1121353 RepID=M1UUD9_9CORY|nr:hypothetical protein [Corynebacterium callunae]AGG66897.1 hypothetical protein H924_07275 [Corynebacterium callunae DSM 20147]
MPTPFIVKQTGDHILLGFQEDGVQQLTPEEAGRLAYLLVEAKIQAEHAASQHQGSMHEPTWNHLLDTIINK